jgi:hypothetical protein
VGLEPTTYGLTVRERPFCVIPPCTVTCGFVPAESARTHYLRERFAPDSPRTDLATLDSDLLTLALDKEGISGPLIRLRVQLPWQVADRLELLS